MEKNNVNDWNRGDDKDEVVGKEGNDGNAINKSKKSTSTLNNNGNWRFYPHQKKDVVQKELMKSVNYFIEFFERVEKLLTAKYVFLIWTFLLFTYLTTLVFTTEYYSYITMGSSQNMNEFEKILQIFFVKYKWYENVFYVLPIPLLLFNIRLLKVAIKTNIKKWLEVGENGTLPLFYWYLLMRIYPSFDHQYLIYREWMVNNYYNIGVYWCYIILIIWTWKFLFKFNDILRLINYVFTLFWIKKLFRIWVNKKVEQWNNNEVENKTQSSYDEKKTNILNQINWNISTLFDDILFSHPLKRLCIDEQWNQIPDVYEIININFINDNTIFIELWLHINLKTQISELQRFDWFLAFESRGELCKEWIKKITWLSKWGKNGLLITLNEIWIDLSDIYQYPDLLKPSSLLEEWWNLSILFWKSKKGDDVIYSLEKLYHILIWGMTWWGKSVWLLNTIISLLKNRLRGVDLNLIIVDWKWNEFSSFENLSWIKIVTEIKQMWPLLNKICIEMDERYKKFRDVKCRNLWEYIKKGYTDMWYEIVVFDELADLMMRGEKDEIKENESNIIRLAQKARACGIHLVLCTQDPRVEVVKPLIKSNMPSTLWFKTKDSYKSKIIIEDDSLVWIKNKWEAYLDAGADRIHLKTYYLSDDDIDKFVKYYKKETSWEFVNTDIPNFTNIEDLVDFMKYTIEKHNIKINYENPEFKLIEYLILNKWYSSKDEIQNKGKEIWVSRDIIRIIVSEFKKEKIIIFKNNNNILNIDYEEDLDNVEKFFKKMAEKTIKIFEEN